MPGKPNIYVERFNKTLVNARLALGLSQVKVAASIGIHVNIYQYFEYGRTHHPMSAASLSWYAETIAAWFELTVRDVLGDLWSRCRWTSDLRAKVLYVHDRSYRERSTRPDPPEAAATLEHYDLLREALQFLHPNERTVIVGRYGLNDGREATLLEVGRVLGVTRERVRQLQETALWRLRETVAYLLHRRTHGKETRTIAFTPLAVRREVAGLDSTTLHGWRSRHVPPGPLGRDGRERVVPRNGNPYPQKPARSRKLRRRVRRARAEGNDTGTR